MQLSVGAGVLEAMARRGDHPLRDSEFLTTATGSSYERGLGTLGYYHASNAAGTWEVTLEPFRWEVEGAGLAYIDRREALPTRDGQRPYPKRPTGSTPDLYVLHYTASPPETTVEAVAAFQTGPNAPLDFPAIAYHLVVDDQGALSWCHSFDVRVWGSDGVGVNERAVHACYTGNSEPSDLQLAGLRAGLLLAEREISRSLTVEGHKDRSRTACPGPTWPAWRSALVN